MNFNDCYYYLDIIFLLLQTAFHDRIYQLKIHCGPSYPQSPPSVRFINKLNMKEIGANGVVSI